MFRYLLCSALFLAATESRMVDTDFLDMEMAFDDNEIMPVDGDHEKMPVDDLVLSELDDDEGLPEPSFEVAEMGLSKLDDDDIGLPEPSSNVAESALEEGSDRIINGFRTSPRIFAHQVMVLAGGSLCGGALITPQDVLTAAHCVPSGRGRVTIRLGIRTRSEQRINGASTRHPGYTRGSVANDIATVVMDRQAILSLNVYPAPVNRERNEFNTFALLSGYGTVGFQGERRILPGDQLMAAWNRVVGFGGSNIIFVRDASARSPPFRAACFGDSGGPLSRYRGRLSNGRYTFTVLGVTSFVFSNNGRQQCGGIGPGGAGADVRSGYTRASSYVSWIQQETRMSVQFI